MQKDLWVPITDFHSSDAISLVNTIEPVATVTHDGTWTGSTTVRIPEWWTSFRVAAVFSATDATAGVIQFRFQTALHNPPGPPATVVNHSGGNTLIPAPASTEVVVREIGNEVPVTGRQLALELKMIRSAVGDTYAGSVNIRGFLLTPWDT